MKKPKKQFDTRTTRYMMETGLDKTKVIINNPNGFHREIWLKDQRLVAVKYLVLIPLTKDPNI